MSKKPVRLITVCDACFRASCWHGEFFCKDYLRAGTVKKTEAELLALNVEHPSQFSQAKVERICGSSTYA